MSRRRCAGWQRWRPGGAPPDEVFASVAAEASQLLRANYTAVSRYDQDGMVTVIGGWADDPGHPLLAGLRLKPEGRNIQTLVLQTRQPDRMDDYGAASGEFGDIARDRGFRASAGVPSWLTNTARHADASGADVEVAAADGILRVLVRDDGRGGADFSGSGLTGLRDRVEAFGGRISLTSPAGAGTALEIVLSLDSPA